MNMRESFIAFAVQNIREGIQTANTEQESHYRDVYKRLAGEAYHEESEAFYRRIAEIQAASPAAVEITARCSGGGTTWTEDHRFDTIADAVLFAWSDEPYQRGIVTVEEAEILKCLSPEAQVSFKAYLDMWKDGDKW